MKFLTFTDLHEDKEFLKLLVNRAKEDDIDFVVCCGDISTFGRGLLKTLETFNKIGKKFYCIPGNHEEHGAIFNEAVKQYDFCVSLHEKSIKIKNYVFLGHGGGGFSLEDADFRKLARDWYGKFNGEKIVLVTHQPPYGTKLDLLGERHVGNKDYTKFINRVNPKLSISGHLHETAGQEDKIKSTKLANPGWEGMVVELI